MNSISVPATTQRVCVAVPTFRRPHLLGDLLSKIGAQDLDGIAMELVVIDNDAACSARPIVAAFAERAGFPVSYESLPSAALSGIRNRAIATAEERHALLVMIDDDESPSPNWLKQLVAVQSDTDADAVIGPVPPQFPAAVPQWIVDGKFFDLAQASDRSLIDDGYTGNCLIRIESVRAMELAFDPRMDRSGGEDQLFFRQMYARGGRIAYAARAVATEAVAPERLTARWLLRRNMRKGHTIAICDRWIDGTPRALAIRSTKALGLVATGVVLFIPRALGRGAAGAMRSACDAARGIGMVMGLVGIRMNYYALRGTGKQPVARRAAAANDAQQAVRPPRAAK